MTASNGLTVFQSASAPPGNWLEQCSPRIEPDTISKPYWEAVASGGLSVQKCDLCSIAFFPPRPVCPSCHSEKMVRWVSAGSTGKLHSFTICHYSTVEGFVPPFPIIQVELDALKNILMLAFLGSSLWQELYIGLRVELAPPFWHGGVAYPVFRPIF